MPPVNVKELLPCISVSEIANLSASVITFPANITEPVPLMSFILVPPVSVKTPLFDIAFPIILRFSALAITFPPIIDKLLPET